MKNSKQGSALITALFIMTLIAIIVTAMNTHIRRDIYRAHLVIDSAHLRAASQIVSFWAMDRLNDPTQSLIHVDAKGRILEFPEALQGIYPGITLTGEIFDLQARFNLNNLRDPIFRVYFYQLLEQTLQDMPSPVINHLIRTSIDWILPYQENSLDAHFINLYKNQKPPYLPAHLPMADPSEFRLIDGVTAQIAQQMMPFLTALPDITPINIYTATRPVLKTLGNGLSSTQVEKIIKLRQKKGLNSIQSMRIFLNSLNIPSQQITTESQYFLVITHSTTHTMTQTQTSILQRIIDVHGKRVVKIYSIMS